MIDLKSALESVQYNTGALGGNSSNQTSNLQTQQTGGNAGILASILQKIAPALAGGGTVPPVA